MMVPKSERIGSLSGRGRVMEQVDVYASVGPKRRQVTLAGMDGSIDIDFDAIDDLREQLARAKQWLAPVKAVPGRARAA